ncbi:MAG: hypothetical protein WD749_02130 [Phycisphaerales bacterium]
MATFPVWVWVVLGLVAVATVVAVLGRLAAAVEDEKRLHDARVIADRLRRQYAAQLAAQHTQHEVIEVEVIEDGPGPVEMAPKARAA